jgi:hypothetical protein
MSVAEKKVVEPFATRRRNRGVHKEREEQGNLVKSLNQQVLDFENAKGRVERIGESLAERRMEASRLSRRIEEAGQRRPTSVMDYLVENPVRVHQRRQECDKIVRDCKAKLFAINAEIGRLKREMTSAKNNLVEAEVIEKARRKREESKPTRKTIQELQKEYCNWTQEADLDLKTIERIPGHENQYFQRFRNLVRDGKLEDPKMDLGEIQARTAVRRRINPGTGPVWVPVNRIPGDKSVTALTA